MRPDKDEIDNTRVEINVSGIASSSAKNVPAVAIAMVRHASLATSNKKSGFVLGGKKSARNRELTLRFSASSKIQGLNSVAINAGTKRTIITIDQNNRPVQAGSLSAGLIGRTKERGTALSPTVNDLDRSWLRGDIE